MIDMKDVKALYKMFQGSDIGEIEIQSGEKKLRLSFSGVPTPAPTIVSPVSVEVDTKSKQNDNTSDNELKSNWVGFFTRLNPKTKENYIKLRDLVKKGQVLGHVRVLGVLQDVVAQTDGKVKEILVEEGQPIEYGQPIMRFEK